MDMISETVVGSFRDHYTATFLDCLKKYPEKDLKIAAQMILHAVQTRKSVIYIFGNGGSHAITRHFEIALQSLFSESKFGIRTRCGVDFHAGQARSIQQGYASLFVSQLKQEKAGSEDLVVLISGSGDSDNLLEAADYCRTKKIPMFSLAGFNGGKLSMPGISSLPLVAHIPDQQICEDAIQPMLRLLARYAYELYLKEAGADFETVRTDLCATLEKSVRAAPVSFFSALSEGVASAMCEGRKIFVCGPEGQGLSVSAEHIAHNYNWDAVFGLADPPQRHIFSSPTSCDFSGVGNDRMMAGVVICQLLDRASAQDILFLFVHDTQAASVINALAIAKKKDMIIYMLHGKAMQHGEGVTTGWCKSDDVFVTSDAVQVLGHISARLVRQQLKKKLNQKDFEDSLAQLTGEDMAQRRLITTAPGL